MSPDSLCRWQVQVFIYCACASYVHPVFNLLHLMDICFLPSICLWKISQIQTLYVWLSELDLSRHHPFYEKQHQPSSGDQWPACPKTVNRAPISGVGCFDTICTTVCNRCDNSTACRLCCLEPISPHLHLYP